MNEFKVRENTGSLIISYNQFRRSKLLNLLNETLPFKNLRDEKLLYLSSKCMKQDHYKNMIPFNTTYPLMKQHLTQKINHGVIARRLEELLDYQVPFGRQTRAAIVVNVHEAMNPQFELKKYDKLQPFHVMAWIVELVQAGGITIDDIVDDSKYRRNKLAWHMGREKFVASHAAMLFCCSRFLLFDYFKDAPYFKAALKLLDDHIFKILYMEDHDLHISELIKKGEVSLDLHKSYSIDKAIYSTELPFKLAVYSATNEEIILQENVEKILADLAYVMQLLNDTLDYFSKIGTGKERFEDIKKGKLTWVLAYIMENATDVDANIVARNYGIEDDRCAEKVVHVYDKFDWEEKYLSQEKELMNSINEQIKKVPNDKGLRAGLEVTQEIISKGYRITNPNNQKFVK